MIAAFCAPTGEGALARRLALLIAVATVARIVLAQSLGLGIDEAYTVATSRVWALSTYDHPPMAWWLARGAATLLGSETPLAVRLPFIGLAAVSTWLIYDAGRSLFSARAGFFAAVTYSLSPVLAWTSGSMVLPDGPLMAALLGGVCCLARAMFGPPDRAARWWLLAGLATGFACLSKLHGIFLLAGCGLFIVTTPSQRHWMRSPWPYLAALVACLMFAPVIVWNIEHRWVSFAFQAGRAHARTFAIWGPFIALAGQSLLILPWIWGALVISLVRAALHGPRRPREWLVFCLAIGPIAVFSLVALGGTKTLFHWAAPGYLFACLLLGRDVAADLADGRSATRIWLRGSAIALAVLYGAVLLLTKMPWPALSAAGGPVVPFPLIETVSWGELRGALETRGLLGRPDLKIAGLKWHETGRIDVALAGAATTYCLGPDARGFGVIRDRSALAEHDFLIVTQEGIGRDAIAALVPGSSPFVVDELAPVAIHHVGQTMLTLHLYAVHRSH